MLARVDWYSKGSRIKLYEIKIIPGIAKTLNAKKYIILFYKIEMS